MAEEIEVLVTEFRADIKRYEAALRKQVKATEESGRQSRKKWQGQTRGMSRDTEAMARRVKASLGALALGAGLKAGIGIIADFGQAMSGVKAVSGATEAQFASLEAKARQLGSTTRFSATEAAEGMAFLARAGFDADQVLGSIEGSLMLAQAGAVDLGTAADISSNILGAFRLEVSEIGRVVDVMAATTSKSNTDIQQLGDAMKMVAPVAAGMGISIEETAAAIGELSNNGLQATMAGTGLRKILSTLESPASNVEKILADLGIKLEDVRPSSVGLTKALETLNAAGVDTGQALQLFGERGGPAFEVLSNGIPTVKRLNGELDVATGTAAEMARVMDDNLSGAMKATQSRLQELTLAIGEAGAETALIEMMEALSALLSLAAENLDILSVAAIGLTVRALIPMSAALYARVAPALIRFQTQLAATSSLAGVASVSVRGLSAAMALLGGPATIAITALTTAVAYFVLTSKDATDELRKTEEAMQRVATLSETVAADTKKLAVLQATLTEAMETQGEAAQRTAALEVEAVQRRIGKNKELIAVYETLAAVSLQNAEDKFNKSDQAFRKKFGTETRRVETIGPRGDPRTSRVTVPLSNDQVQARQQAILEARRAGQSISDADQEFLEALGEREDLRLALIKQQDAYKALTTKTAESPAPSAEPGAVSSNDDAPVTAREAKVALDDLQKAYRDTFESEREMVTRIRDERLAAINKTKEAEGEKAAKRSQVNDIYLKEMADIREAEGEAFDTFIEAELARAAAIEARTQTELDLLNQLRDARDQMHGRTLEMVEREYAARRANIDAEIQDEARKTEALKLLAEEEAEFRRQMREEVLGLGASSASEADRIRAEGADKLAALKEAFELELITREEFEARKLAIAQEAETSLVEMKERSSDAQRTSSERMYGGLGDAAKKFFGEQSGLYKAAAAVEKAFAIQSAIVSTYKGANKALAEVPFPLNIAAAGAITALGVANVAQISSSSPGYADGIVGLRGPGSGRSDSITARLSRGESVITAAATAANPNVLAAINSGANFERSLSDNQPSSPSLNLSSQFNFNGPVDDSTVDTFASMIAASEQRTRDFAERSFGRQQRLTTPRHKRGGIN